VKPWVFNCCTAIQNSPVANYYRRVAEFTQEFMAIERDSFAID
jgi:TorA maturation chaperone TorD